MDAGEAGKGGERPAAAAGDETPNVVACSAQHRLSSRPSQQFLLHTKKRESAQVFWQPPPQVTPPGHTAGLAERSIYSRRTN